MKKLILLLPIIAGILWGTVGIFVRILQNFGMDRITVLSSKMILASIILGIGIFIYERKWLKIKIKDIWLFIASGIMGMMMLNFCYNESIDKLTLSFAAILLSMSPIFVMFMAAVIFKEKITTKKIVCTLLAIVGCILVSGFIESVNDGSWSFYGLTMGLSAAFFYAVYGIFSKKAAERGYNVFTITFYSALTVSIALIPFTDWGIIGEFVEETPVTNSVFMFLYASCNVVFPYILYTAGVAHGDAGKASILAAGGEPAAAMVFGIIFFTEVPTVLNLVGLVITIVALAYICLPDKRRQ